MRLSLSCFVAIVIVIASLLMPSAPLVGQYLKYPTYGVPRTADGKPNLLAPTPRIADGKPDLSGLWFTDDAVPCRESGGAAFFECGIELPLSQYGVNYGYAIPGGLPYQPWAAALVKQRMAENAKDDPHVRCLPDTFLRSYGLPHYQKWIQIPRLLVQLDEMNAMYRQIFTDGRPLPVDPNPAWNGYSTAKWAKDTLVVDSNGFRDDLWIDISGSFISEAARIRERITRPNYGHMLIEVTVDDAKVYTKPWTVTLKERIVLDTDLIDEICLENEKSYERISKTK
jgi:hypothetical protein